MTLACPGVQESLKLQVTDLQGLVSVRSELAEGLPVAEGKPGQLKLAGVDMRGKLADGQAADEPPPWLPEFGLRPARWLKLPVKSFIAAPHSSRLSRRRFRTPSAAPPAPGLVWA